MNLQTKNILGAAGIAATLFLASCTKTFDEKVEQQRDFSNSSILQVYMGTVSASRNYVYVDSKPVNGAAIALGGLFPATGYGFSVPIGVRAFLIRDTLTATTQTPLSFAENMQPNKNYTIFMYDTINAVPAVDVFSKRRNQNIFTNVSVTDVTNFIPYASRLTDTLSVRATGTTTDLAVLNGITPTEKRSYTIVFRGRYETTSGTIARTLSSFVNF
jgi:hypothetical protein